MKISREFVSGLRQTGTLALVLPSFSLAAATHSVRTVSELTNAISRAANGDVIQLAAGRYDLSALTEWKGSEWGVMSTPDTSAGRSCLWFSKSLVLRGENAAHWGDRSEAEETILDGGGAAGVVYAYTGTGRNSTFENITFLNGAAESGKNGGGLHAIGPTGRTDTPSFGLATNCVFRNCHAANGGGTHGFNVVDSLYDGCSAANEGGGAWGTGNASYVVQSTNHFARCVFRNCTAKQGAGLYHQECRSTEGKGAGYVADCVFSNCTTETGSVLYERCAGLVRNCRFESNLSRLGAVYGENLFERTLLTNCTFIGNVSTTDGGGIGKWQTAADSSFIGNVASNHAGAAVNCAAFERCEFADNLASKDGGAVVGGTMTNCVFKGNAAKNQGGALKDGVAMDCSFTRNCSTNQGGACAYATLVGCSFNLNGSAAQRGGALFQCQSRECAFTNNWCAPVARGGACAFTQASGCVFSGFGDVSCGSYDRCLFDGVSASAAPGQRKWVFDCLRNSGGGIYVTNCLVVGCAVDHVVNGEGQNAEFVNCTFADNAIANGRMIVLCDGGTDYRKNAAGENRLFPGTNVFVNCLFSGNRFENGSGADLAVWKRTSPTDFGCCSLQLFNCLYTDGAVNLDHADRQDGLVRGNPRFVAGDARFPDEPWYSIRYASAARNAGLNAPWMDGATDLAGRARVFGGTVDVGCYECALPNDATLLVFR